MKRKAHELGPLYRSAAASILRDFPRLLVSALSFIKRGWRDPRAKLLAAVLILSACVLFYNLSFLLGALR